MFATNQSAELGRVADHPEVRTHTTTVIRLTSELAGVRQEIADLERHSGDGAGLMHSESVAASLAGERIATAAELPSVDSQRTTLHRRKSVLVDAIKQSRKSLTKSRIAARSKLQKVWRAVSLEHREEIAAIAEQMIIAVDDQAEFLSAAFRADVIDNYHPGETYSLRCRLRGLVAKGK